MASGKREGGKDRVRCGVQGHSVQWGKVTASKGRKGTSARRPLPTPPASVCRPARRTPPVSATMDSIDMRFLPRISQALLLKSERPCEEQNALRLWPPRSDTETNARHSLAVRRRERTEPFNLAMAAFVSFQKGRTVNQSILRNETTVHLDPLRFAD